MIERENMMTEYDNYFLNDPGKWAGEERNQFAEKLTRAHISYPQRILDVGCGNGHTLKHFKSVFPEAGLFGLDLSPVACKIASDNVEGAVIFEGFVEDADFDVPFDLILCLGVAEHFLDLENGLKGIQRSLSETGTLYLEVPNCLSYDPGEEGYRRLSIGSRQMEWHLKRETWENIIEQSGFKIVEAFKGLRPEWEFVWILRK